jgi:predicted peptidase
MTNSKISAFIIFFLVFSFSTISQEAPVGASYLEKSFKSNGQNLLYRIMYPKDFDQNKKYPLVLFLHGAGERGKDNKKQLSHGSNLFLDSLEKYPAIVLFPQCPPEDYWANLYRPDKGGASRKFEFHTDEAPHPTMVMVLELIDKLWNESYIDKSRFYVSGLSMGAFGVWELLWRIPNKIAAAMPICGGGPPNMALKMIEVPMWAFHGVKDNVVHVRYSRRMVTAVQQAGGKAKITLYPNANHNSWDPAFAEPTFLKWMFSKTK